jgi:hypothetical protein
MRCKVLPDPEALAELVAVAIKTATAPLVARITALEQRPVITPKDGKDGEPGPAGKDADEAALISLKSEIDSMRSQIKSLDVQYLDIPAFVKTEIASAVGAIPAPKDGEPGQSVDPEEVRAMVKAAVDDIPKPQDGRSVTVDDVGPVLLELVTKAVEALPKPKDGVSVVDALVDRDGHLVQTFSDGRTKVCAVVVGKDGRDVDMEAVKSLVVSEVAKIPPPKDGKDGRDGRLDGGEITLVDLDPCTKQFQFSDGTPVKGSSLVPVPHLEDAGVWREDVTYRKGDGVSFGGSFFIAQKDNPGKPETDDSWRLAVKRGRDGRNGRDVVPGPKPPVKVDRG